MNSDYMPIPSDSDNEDENMVVPDNDYDGGSDRSRSTDRAHFFSQAAADTDEEDPEEDPTDNTDPRSSRPISPPPGPRARTRATARKRVPIPIMTRIRSPEPSVPTTDPYACPSSHSQGWERTLGTLRNWKNFGHWPSSVRGKGPVTARYEPILDTTPIIVDQMVIHENRLDIMEEAIMERPGGEAFNELQERVYNAEGNISHVNDTVQSLKARFETNTWDFNE